LTRFRLRLEWNKLGAMDSNAFTGFCDALAVNKSLIELDLRNNDISHVGGTELALALKRNSTLRRLGIVSSRIFNETILLLIVAKIFVGIISGSLVAEHY
jgi:hypothetical protein